MQRVGTRDRAVLPCGEETGLQGDDMRDIYIGSIATPYVLKGSSSVAGMPLVHQR